MQPESFDDLSARIAQSQRKALLRTFVLAFATVAVAALFLVFVLGKLNDAYRQLAQVNDRIETATAAGAKAQRALDQARHDLEQAQRELATAQGSLKSETERATALQSQVVALETQLTALKKQLMEALDLGKHVYKLEWGELKEMASLGGAAASVLEVINSLKSQVHWGMSNTPAGGYNSPGFAKLVLQRLHKLPDDGNLDSLPHGPEPPVAGDIVVYQGGYHLFYFRDHTGKEFVVGMTPFGVLSLNYDFEKRLGVLHTGFSPH
jgi:hypothetical protein